ncbi:MAG: MBL fold metallo-hydrolase [Marinoscillum sp.]
MKIKTLPAFNGDSILISFIDSQRVNRNILIDGGISRTYPKHLKRELSSIIEKGDSIDLLVITHIDDDHIGGIIKLYEDTEIDRSFIKQVWFNSGNLLSDFFESEREKEREVEIIPRNKTEMSVGQGITLESALVKEGNWFQKIVYTGLDVIVFHGAKVTILSPNRSGLEKLQSKWETEKDKITLMSGEHDDFNIPISELIKLPFKEDQAVPNGSSIAFMIEHDGKKALLLGDAHPSVIESSLRNLSYSAENKLQVDLVKVSHHSSKKNTSSDLLALIECSRFIISTDGNKHGLPDKQAMARIIASNVGCSLYFNYDSLSDKIFTVADKQQYHFQINTLYQHDYTIAL